MTKPIDPSPHDPVWDDPRITAYILEELPAEQRQLFEQEMTSSPALAAAVEEARQIVGDVSALYASEAKPALSDAQRETLRHATTHSAALVDSAERTASGRGGFDDRYHLSGRRMLMAASVLFLLGLGSGLLLPAMRESTSLSSLSLQGTADEASVESSVAAPRSAPSSVRRALPNDSSSSRSNGGRETAESQRTSRMDSPPPTSDLTAVAPTEKAQGAPVSSSAPGMAGGMGGGIGGMAHSGDRKESLFEGETGGYGPAPGDVARPGNEITASPTGVPLTDRGRGPGMAGDQFQPITDNPFRRIEEHPLSTFSIDVDTASYAKVRSYLLQGGMLPRPDAVRIEELINYFDYDYAPPEADEASSDEPAAPFASHVEFAACPWQPEHRLARIGIKGKEIAREERPAGNFVFLLDVSGSMNQPNKLPLLKRGMQMLLEQLNEEDRIAIVVYAGAAGLVLDSTPGDRLADVRDALNRLRAGGSTNGGDGIQLAYNVARDHFIEGGVNRVILCTDGDFNVGTTGTDSLVRIVEEEAKGGVFLSVLGFGMGNHNDTMLEQISGRGNGNYAFIDTIDEAHKVLVEQVAGTLVTIAKDVKIQVKFNPAEVAAYRLIGYENRILAKEDFNDDTKDAGEIGAGHSVTALYELVPAGKKADPIAPEVDPLRYQIPARKNEVAQSGEWLTIKLRYKEPDGDTSRLVQFPAKDDGADFAAASRNFQFAASVASFGMLLRNSPYKGEWTLDAVEESAAAAIGDDPSPRRSEFLRMVQKAAELSGR